MSSSSSLETIFYIKVPENFVASDDAFKIDNKEASSVNSCFKLLKELLGYEKFHELFPIILTDNGVEFSKPDEIELNGNHVFKTKLFYCDPGHSEQKGKIENNHECHLPCWQT